MSSKLLGGFRKAQGALLERLLGDTELTDAIAIIGVEAERVPIHKALWANVSEPFRKALYGTFREGQTRELFLPDVDLVAFRQIQRTAAGLEPELTSNNVVATLRAAQMYMIKELTDECHRFILDDVHADGVLNVLTACILHGIQLPNETEHALWCIILSDCKGVLRSESFLSAHSMIVLRLLKLDEFGVEEEILWLRLVEWTANLKNNVHLIGSLLDNDGSTGVKTSTSKRRKISVDENSDAEDFQASCLQALSVHIRFAAMDKTFFADNVMEFLQPETVNNILLFYLLGRPSGFSDKARENIRFPKPEALWVAVTSQNMPDQAQRLLQGDARWEIDPVELFLSGIDGKLYVSVPTDNEVVITQINLTAVKWSSIEVVRISVLGGTNTTVYTRPGPARGQTLKISCEFAPACNWVVEFEEKTADEFVLTKMQFIGHLSQKAHTAAVVRQRSTDLFVTSCE